MEFPDDTLWRQKMAGNHGILRALLVLVSIILLVSIFGCKGNTGPLEDITDQVKFYDITDRSTDTQGGSSYKWRACTGLVYIVELQVNSNTWDNVPERPVWVWTVFLDDGLLTEIVHDTQSLSAGASSSRNPWELWPYDDFIEYEFTAEGTYRIRTDMYYLDEYESLQELAPCYGSYTQTLDCQQLRATITAAPTGESREYSIYCQVTNDDYMPSSGHYDATLQIINNETGAEEQLIGDHRQIEWVYRQHGVDAVIYRFQSEGDYRLIYTLDYSEHDYVKSGVPLIEEVLLSTAVTSAEYSIEAPYSPLGVGEEYTFQALKKGVPAEAPYYVWDFGDGEGISMPYSNEATHAYQNEGTYIVLLQVYSSDGEDALLLGTAYKTVDVGMTIIRAYQRVDHIDIDIYTYLVWQYEEGKELDPDGSGFAGADTSVGCRATTSKNEITWNGTEFKIRLADSDFTCTGQISDDGSKLLYLDVNKSWDTGSLRGSSHYYLTNVPLTTTTGVSGPPDAMQVDDIHGYYRFEFSATGADVQSYISSQAHHWELEDNTGKLFARNYVDWYPEQAHRNRFEIVFYKSYSY
jgi:hypothetical protein